MIAADISYLEDALGDTKNLTTLPSVRKYLDSLHDEITTTRLTAHHYIRYLGDLSGGQAIARLVARHYQIPAEALNFYNFEDIGDVVFYKKRYRDFLNLIALNEEQQEEFLSEVELLYALNRELFMDLGNLHSADVDTP
jgi:heme oxygenase